MTDVNDLLREGGVASVRASFDGALLFPALDTPLRRLRFTEPSESQAVTSKFRWQDHTTNAQDLCDRRFPEVSFVVPGLFPEGVTLLVSRPKTGKSWLLLQIGSGVAEGTSPLVPTEQPVCGDVLYLSLEDGDRRVQRRMSKYFGASRGNWPRRLMIARAWRRLDQGGIDDLREWSRSVRRPTLIMIDTLKKVRPSKKKTQSDYDADYGACEGLLELVREFPGLAIIVAHHDRKMDAADVFDTVSGTLGLTGGVDTIAIIKRSTQGKTLHIQGRDLVEEVEKAIKFDRETCRWSILGEAAEVHRSAERAAIIEVLRSAPPEGMTVAEIMGAAEIGKRDAADQTLGRMTKAGEIERRSRGRYGLHCASRSEASESQKSKQPIDTTCLNQSSDASDTSDSKVTPRGRPGPACDRANRGQGVHDARRHRTDEGAMPRRSKGARLWLQPAVRDERGRIIENAVWCIRDGRLKRRTGLGEGAAEHAKETALREYLIAKQKLPRERDRDPTAVKIADVVAIYAEDMAHRHARPEETAARLGRILDHFGEQGLSELNQRACEEYVQRRGKQSAARRELEDLRAAVLHHWRQGLCIALTPVVLPPRGETRERWLTRSEAARLLWAAWRLTQRWKGRESDRRTAQHIARFILVGLYTGTRAGAICGAALEPTEGRGWVDLDRGVFYRRALSRRRTKKRQPSIRIPPRLLAHMRRWQRRGLALSSVIEWNGKSVRKINKAFRSVRRAAKLGDDVVPHTLRHTAITWQAQLGVPEHEILGFFGITREVFEQVYAHHHPDYQSNAVNAFTRAGQKSDSFAATKRERTRSNVANIA
jgi:hypothetical protein